MRRLVGALFMAVVLTACYPVSPTPQQCQMERFPPPCGCPNEYGPGFYVKDVIYWPQNPPPLDRCVG